MRLLLVALVALVAAGIFTVCITTNTATTPTLDIETTIEARPTPTLLPTVTPSPVPTLAPKPTETPRPTPTAIPLPTATPEPTLVPTVSPTPSPTPIPTATPTPTPTPLPPKPTPTPLPPTPLPPTSTPTVTPALLELHYTQNTQWLKRAYRDLYRQIQRFAWVQDGLSSLETNTIDELLYIGVDEIANLRETLNLPWLQDAISEREYEAIDRLRALGYYDPASLEAALKLSWLQDTVSETEYDIVHWLASVGYEAPQVIVAMISMPFLESPDANDALAIRSMARLADKGVVSKVVGHPIFQDGITDAQTTLVAAAGALYRDVEEIGRLLDPGYAAIETVSSGTKLTPGLKVSIVRTETQSRPGTIEAVKDAVAFIERVMGLPLPVDHVIVLLNDKAVTSDYAGTNYGFAVGYLPKYERRQGTYEWHRLQAGLVHEVAHYFWSGNVGWIDEGVADTVEYMYGLENGLSRGKLKPHRKNCEAYDLAMLSEWDPDSSSSRYLCNYYLGQGLFQELLESLGDEGFGKRLHELYELSLTKQKSDWIPGIAAVRQAFEDQSDIVDKHWAGALNAPENRAFEEGVYRENHHLIQWDQYPTYDGRSVTFEGTLLGDAVLVNDDPRSGGYQNFTLSLTDKPKFVGYILPDVSGNWPLDNDGDVVASKYFFYPATRKFTVTFPFPAALNSPQDYIVVVWGFQDASRTISIGDYDGGGDVLGYARIRMP